MKVLGGLVLVVVMTALTAVLGAWLWNLVLPDLFGVRHIGIVDAFGICVVIHFFAYQPKGKSDDRTLGEAFRARLVESVSIKVSFVLMGLAYWVLAS